MDLGLNNKCALVLASSKGLGFACAKEFYEEGANIVICSRSEDNLRKAVNSIEIKEKKNRIHSIVADLTVEDDIKDLINETMKEFGRIDILIHNAGGPPSGSIDSINSDDWMRSIDLNLRSLIKITRFVIPIMKKQKSGRIIMITSVSVKQPLKNLVLSNTTRLGVVGYAKTLSNEYAKNNILVNVVCPGPNLTDRMKELIKITVKNTGKSEEEVKKSWTDQIPLGRLGNPEELAHLVVFLASEKASYITGTVIQVDGGFVKSTF
ncbi:MAG: SDR family oxidoreductase [Promethearchaeota archaeon]